MSICSVSRHAPRAFIVLVFALTLPAGKAIAATPANLQEATARLALASSPSEYAAMLEAFSTALPPPDAYALLCKSLASVGPGFRKALTVKTGGLALLLGLFEDAASHFEAAARLESADAEPSGLDRDLLIRAARCYVAAGDADKAETILSAARAPNGEASSFEVSLIGAWALLLQGRSSEASAAAQAVLETPQGVTGPSAAPAVTPAATPEQRREARFIRWLCADKDKQAELAAQLAKEFPDSLEAQIVSGAVTPPPLPHWYLGGLTLAPPSVPAGRGSGAAASPIGNPSAPKAPEPATSPASGDKPGVVSAARSPANRKRLQVGYFSVEANAEALKDELVSKRFAAAVESRQRSVGGLESQRWIVVVDGGKDIGKTVQSLKDSGYESYIIE